MAGTSGSRDRRAALDDRRARRAAVTDPQVGLDAAAQFLGVRPRSVAETRRRLLHLGYSEALTEEVLLHLERLGFLDDRGFAKSWIESRDRSRPRGEAALRQELRRKGVDEMIVRDILDARRSTALAEDDAAAAAGEAGASNAGAPGSADRRAARRLMDRRSAALRREADPRKRRQKAYAMLARHGFDPVICREESLAVVASGDADVEDPSTDRRDDP